MDCKKCKGTGIVRQHINVEGGRCYRCGGSGKEEDYQKKVQEEKRRQTEEYKQESKEAFNKIQKAYDDAKKETDPKVSFEKLREASRLY